MKIRSEPSNLDTVVCDNFLRNPYTRRLLVDLLLEGATFKRALEEVIAVSSFEDLPHYLTDVQVHKEED